MLEHSHHKEDITNDSIHLSTVWRTQPKKCVEKYSQKDRKTFRKINYSELETENPLKFRGQLIKNERTGL